MFSDQINKLVSEEDLKDAEKLLGFKDDMLGSEVYASGLIKKNSLFNNLEMTIRDIEKVDVNELIEKLESN